MYKKEEENSIKHKEEREREREEIMQKPIRERNEIILNSYAVQNKQNSAIPGATWQVST